MRKVISFITGLAAAIVAAQTAQADSTWEYSVQLSATVQASPAQITLSWPQDLYGANSYTVYRKTPSATSWGAGTTLPGSTTTYADSSVTVGTAYEYQVIKAASGGYTGYGYIYSGINVPMTEDRGKLLLVVDNTYASSLTNELSRLQQDLVGDGWTVIRQDVGRSDSVVSVKNWIKTQYTADPANVKMVFLFGHVPVPYSGNIVPDGHVPNHQGAWPCDGFYGDMDGTWTDTSVNITSADYSRNYNTPGDGKFDQSTFPAPLKLMVGRVDLSNMPSLTWTSELELLRNYLNKDHKFRTRQFDLPRRAIIGDYFGDRNGEAFVASGWRNFAPFFGANNIVNMPNQATWAPALTTTPYLCAYGCGAGSFITVGGLGTSGTYNDLTTSAMVSGDLKFAFGMFFGSWLGDWDSQDNIMRGVLALPSYGLACAWSGRPHWFIQHMGLGETIGYGARLTENNGSGGLYQNQVNTAAGGIHVALMGDPSLRLFMTGPASNVTATTNGSSIALSWTASTDSVLGYHVYRASGTSGTFTRLTTSPTTTTSYTDTSASGAANYMVRAVKLETTASGTYYNPSQGAFLYLNGVSGSSTSSGSGTNSGGGSSTNGTSGTLTNLVAWVDDALPAGAVGAGDGGDNWTWANSNPTAYHGSLANQSTVAAGLHQHYFTGATSTLSVSTGDVLVAYVYIDPANVPTELMLQWSNGSWEHRAYWGANNITYGTSGTASRAYMGALPAAGQWALLQVPASQVGLEGSTLTGMSFTLYDGHATWDYAGKSSVVITNPPSGGGGTTNAPPPSGTNSPPASTNLPNVSLIDYITPQLPNVGDNTLHVLTPTLLELKLINTKALDPAQVAQWNFVANGVLTAPSTGAFAVTANGTSVAVSSVGFKRRPLYAPVASYDLRIENSLYLQISSPISDGQAVEVKNPDGSLWSSSMKFVATVDPLRYSPAVHVNQEGYLPIGSKKAMVGHYAGSLGEVPIPFSAGFKLVDAVSGATAFTGTLALRADSGWTYSPTPYQKVYEADFTSFTTPGEYRLVVPGMGGSLPFLINDGVTMNFARAYALGLYHQRCGTNTAMPSTRFEHGVCHAAPSTVPTNATAYPFTWTTVAGYATSLNANNPAQIAPALTSPTAALWPFVNTGAIDTTGGHHDAGDYSKYTINSASLVHYLMFAVDSLQGVAALDNLGIPESGDGISDVMQEAKWEADFLAKLQDADGGFYFLVYPQNREYESNVTPDHGDPQVVWPKNSATTAASVAALAQCASSPLFKSTYPAAAAAYLAKAQKGWQFLLNAINARGKNGIYQKITHYGDNFTDADELAWAACQMFLATGDANAHTLLRSWFDPADPATWRWGWWHMSECFGHAIRSYAFAAQSGRVANTSALDATFLAKCQAQIAAAGDDTLAWSQQSAYGTSFPMETKHVQGAGWYFSTDQAFDLAVAYQLNPKADYLAAMLANMNFEGGCNPVNVSYVTGLGWKRQRDIVSQWHVNDFRVLPPSGIPVGNIVASFSYLSTYGSELGGLTFPSEGAATAPYPFYDRWGDSWNVGSEMVILNQGRSLGTLGFLAAQTAYKTQAWKAPANASLTVPTGTAQVGSNVTVTLNVPGLDLASARITWEARDQDPAYGPAFTFAPRNNGPQWVEAEAQWPDGRRAFAKASFNANSANIVWVDDALPAGASGSADGGDAWSWLTSAPTPTSGAKDHQSNLTAGEHQHFFTGATATLGLGTGDILYAWVYLDPVAPPSELMLQWNNGSWEHRAYWGGNMLNYGSDATASRRYIGPLPAVGQWVQLKVPASQVGLEGSTLTGMAFTLYGGRATWDAAGRLNTNIVTSVGTTTVLPRLTLAANGATLTWASTVGTHYTISYKATLTATTWSPLTTVTATATTTAYADTTAPLRGQRYYQIVVGP